MALVTLGSNATTSLQAISYNKAIAQADIATIAANIKDDLDPAQLVVPGAFGNTGILFVPRRGWLKILDGDYVGYDSTGWPILLSSRAITSGPWTHT